MFLDLVQSDGFTLRRVSGTRGGEYAGSCPFCAGVDRFRCWPQEDRAWCRGCGWSGDAIQYCRDFRNLTFKEAHQLVTGREPDQQRTMRTAEPPRQWTPKPTPEPPRDIWQEKTTALIEWASKKLWSPVGAEGQRLLETKGISRTTAEKFKLGWLPADQFRDREQWGLESEVRPDGRPKKVFFPAGLTIPYEVDGQIVRVRFRRKDPKGSDRYILLPGGNTRPYMIGQGQKWIITESELDAILLFQEVGDQTGIIALGNAQAKPDKDTTKILRQAEVILVSLDSDEAGIKEAWQWWLPHFPQAKRWPVPGQFGKDHGDAFKAGLDLKAWTRAALEPSREVKPPRPDLTPEELEDFEERSGIMEFCGGLTRPEAERLAMDLIRRRHATV